MKRIVIFIDGTRNKPDAEHPTNVVRLAQSIKHKAENRMEQIVLYSTGVGSGQGNTWVARQSDSLLGGALGWGLTSIIVNAYRELMFVYEPGDEIMVFGFSRGAFAARSLVGMIRTCGILERASLKFLPEAVERYRSLGDDFHPNADDSHEFRLKHSSKVTTSQKERDWRVERGLDVADVVALKIAYLGVWDTVSAMGLPEIVPISKFTNVEYRFHDAELSSMVEAARHGISLDERRRLYPAYPWSNMVDLTIEYDRRFKPTHLQQWFPGNHGSVGGGGPETGLSSIALNWIALGAREAGLEIDFEELDKRGARYDVTAPLKNWPDEKTVKSSILGSRAMQWLNGDRKGPDSLEAVSMSAVDRAFADAEYVKSSPLAKIRGLIESMDAEQRENMRSARAWVDGALTHHPDRDTRPPNTQEVS